MPQDDQANSNSDKTDNNNNSTSHAGLRRILVTGGIFLGALFLASIYLPNMSERVKFFTVNALSLSVLGAIAVQAYIYSRQWEVMERQWQVMKDTLAETKRIFDLT